MANKTFELIKKTKELFTVVAILSGMVFFIIRWWEVPNDIVKLKATTSIQKELICDLVKTEVATLETELALLPFEFSDNSIQNEQIKESKTISLKTRIDYLKLAIELCKDI